MRALAAARAPGRLTRRVRCRTGDPPAAAAVGGAAVVRGRRCWSRRWSRLLEAGLGPRRRPPRRPSGSLARLAGAAPVGAGLWVPRELTRRPACSRCSASSGTSRRPAWPSWRGSSAGRAHQLLAGAVVAEAVMRRLGIESLDICPWALREGVILRRLDQLDAAVAPWRTGGLRPTRDASPTAASRWAGVSSPRAGAPVHLLGLPRADRGRVRAGRGARLRRRRGDGLDRRGQPGRRGAARAGRSTTACRCCSVHAPCLLVTQRVWSPDPWERLRRSASWPRRWRADRGGAPAVHLAAGLRPRLRRRAGAARRDAVPGVRFAVENMYPVRMAGRRVRAVRAGLGPDRGRLRRLHAGPVALRGRRAPTRWRWPTRWAPAWPTCTSATAPARAATSTWCPGAAPSPGASCSPRWPGAASPARSRSRSPPGAREPASRGALREALAATRRPRSSTHGADPPPVGSGPAASNGDHADGGTRCLLRDGGARAADLGSGPSRAARLRARCAATCERVAHRSEQNRRQ